MTRRAVRIWATQSFAAFGVFALLAQSYQAVWDRSPVPGRAGLVAVVMVAGSVGFGLLRVRPESIIARSFDHPRCRVEIVPGDLFEQKDSHLVVGFTDVFDTDPSDSRIVDEGSLQAQFLRREYDGDLHRLDADLRTALAGTPILSTVLRADKAHGKLERYPLGAVAVLGIPRRRFFCVAYSTMSGGLVARSSTDVLWHSLSRLWDAVEEHGGRQPLAMPVTGAALARVDALDQQSIVRLILLSFVAASRERLRTSQLRIVLRPTDFARIDHLELRAFLDSL